MQYATPKTFPHVLIHFYIFPILLSSHLHELFVEDRCGWDAFSTLVQVSREFMHSCRRYFPQTLGLTEDECLSRVPIILNSTQELWRLVRNPSQPYLFEDSVLSNLKHKRTSLLQIYHYIALARLALNAEALAFAIPLDKLVHVNEFLFGKEDHLAVNINLEASLSIPGQKTEKTDIDIYKVFSPITFAMEICETLRPDVFSYTVAQYLADCFPVIVPIPLFLKMSRDLHTFVIKAHDIDQEFYNNWTITTIGLVENVEKLLGEMLQTSKRVASVSDGQLFSPKVLEVTALLNSLSEVVSEPWGDHSQEINGRASAIIKRWRKYSPFPCSSKRTMDISLMLEKCSSVLDTIE